MHVDNSDVTFNVCLGKEFTGAGLAFCGYMGEPAHRHLSHTYTHRKGRCVVHLGRRRHGADDIASGERMNLIIWNHNLAYRASRASVGLQRQRAYAREAGPPDLQCLSYTHDRDYLEYKVHISPVSPLHLPDISPTSPRHLPLISLQVRGTSVMLTITFLAGVGLGLGSGSGSGLGLAFLAGAGLGLGSGTGLGFGLALGSGLWLALGLALGLGIGKANPNPSPNPSQAGAVFRAPFPYISPLCLRYVSPASPIYLPESPLISSGWGCFPVAFLTGDYSNPNPNPSPNPNPRPA